MSNERSISRRIAAERIGCHVDTLSRLLSGVLRPAVIERKGRGGALVLSAAAVETYVNCMKEKRPLDPLNERARRDCAAADLAEHRLSVARGEFLPKDEVDLVWSRLVAGTRGYLLHFPEGATSAVCRAFQLDGELGVYAELKRAVREALNELAAPDFEAPCPHCGKAIWNWGEADERKGKPARKARHQKKAKRKTARKASAGARTK